MILYRPVGLDELRLLFKTGMCEFPPRFPSQPIFYPVVDEDYARQIAKDWNAKEDLAGFVTRFEVDDVYVTRFQPQRVGAKKHVELWVPAEELAEFNQQINGVIEVVASYYGPRFKMPAAGITAFDDYLRTLFQVALLEVPR